MSSGSRLYDRFAEQMKKEKLEDSNEEFDVMYPTGFIGLDFLNDYVDYVELDPLGNIYNRKSFKQIFTELGIPQNN